ncbi:unnamed protein product, partial [Cochlearia groenlandica]
ILLLNYITAPATPPATPPTAAPTTAPTEAPTMASPSPSPSDTTAPTTTPTTAPTEAPTTAPTEAPIVAPTVAPSMAQGEVAYGPVGDGPSMMSSDECTLVPGMGSCLNFLLSGGADAKQTDLCCIDLKTVLESNPKCICAAFDKLNAMYILPLNISKPSTILGTCNLDAPCLATCKFAKDVLDPRNDGSSLMPIKITTLFTALVFLLFSYVV